MSSIDLPLLPGDLEHKQAIVLLDFDFAGRIWRLSTKPCQVADADGEVYSYEGGLSWPAATEETLGRLEFDTSEASASLEIVLVGADVPALRRQGHDLLSATGSLFMVMAAKGSRYDVPTADQTMEERWHILTGILRSPEFAAPNRPAGWLAFTLEEAPWSEDLPFLDPGMRIDSNVMNWISTGGAVYDDTVTGKPYPIVFGFAGNYSTIRPGAGSPAYCVGRDGAGDALVVLVAGHHVEAQEVTLIAAESGETYVALVNNPLVFGDRFVDGEERPVAFAYVLAASATFRAETEFWACWNTPTAAGAYLIAEATEGGAMVSPFTGGVLESATEVVAWALMVGGKGIDIPRWRALAGRMPRINLAGYINDPDARPWAWLKEHVLPLLPITVRPGPDGLYPVLYDPHLYQGEVVAEVFGSDSGGDWRRVRPIRLEREVGDLENIIEYRYALDGISGAHKLDTVFGAQPDTEGLTAGNGAGLYSRHSIGRYGERPATFESSYIWTTAAASTVAALRARLTSLPVEQAVYQAPLSWGWLQLGDPIAITDTTAGWDGQIAIISGRKLLPSRWEFTILVDEDPVRDERELP